MLPFVVIFLLVGIVLVVAGRKLERKARQAACWPVVPGQLEYCEVVEVPGTQLEDVSSWRLNLRYSYVVSGIAYRSSCYAFGYGDSIDDQKHRRVVDALQHSPELYVRYNPKRPSEAVLSAEVQVQPVTLGYFFLGLAVISALIVLVTG